MNTLEHMMGKLFTVTEHFERFIRSASEIQLDLGYTVEELIDVVRELLKVNNIQKWWYLYSSYYAWCSTKKSLVPNSEVKPVIMAFAKSYDRPYDDLENGINAATVEDIRWLRCDIKSLNLLGNVLCKGICG